jgi:hypothetical protein
MCDCVKDIDENLKADGHCLNASIFGNPRRCAIDLIRTDKWVSENRRNKPRLMLAEFCPFCGEKYVEKQAAKTETMEVA